MKKFRKNQKGISVKITDVKPNIKNPRKGLYDKSELEELKESIECLGQITPVKIDENGILLSGHRRHQAMKELGHEYIICDILTGLSEFNKSAIMISDNTTQKQFNPFDARQSITDIYWNEFCEEYKFKNSNDKGYSEFAKRLGLSMTQVRVIIESMSKEGKGYLNICKREGLKSDVFDELMRQPKENREKLAKLAVKYKKEGKMNIREILRAESKSLIFRKEQAHPSFYQIIYRKIDVVSAYLDKKVINNADDKTKQELKDYLEEKIIKPYREIFKKK